MIGSSKTVGSYNNHKNRNSQACNTFQSYRTCIHMLNIAPKPTMKLKNAFTNIKGKIEKEDIIDVVYGLQCKDVTCRKNKYVGQTGRRVRIRKGEHSKDYENSFLEMEKEQKKEHEINFSIDKVLILDKEPDKFKREFIESAYIRMTGDRANNFRRNTNNLLNGYTKILNLYKDIQSK